MKILPYGNSYYIERIAQLERALSRKPRELQLELVGAGEILADAALRIRDVMLNRDARTRLVTIARSSLQNGAALVWLLGDTRMIRNDAKLFFRKCSLPEDAEAQSDSTWKSAEDDYSDSEHEVDPEEGDYATVLQGINEFLPVKELVGRLIGLPVLKQFGLIENEQVDGFLTTAFRRQPASVLIEEPKQKQKSVNKQSQRTVKRHGKRE